MIISRIGEVARERGFRSALQFQKATGFAYNTANDLYQGNTKRIGFDILAKVCEVLKAEPGELIARVDVDPATLAELNRRVALIDAGQMQMYTEAESEADTDALLDRLERENAGKQLATASR